MSHVVEKLNQPAVALGIGLATGILTGALFYYLFWNYPLFGLLTCVAYYMGALPFMPSATLLHQAISTAIFFGVSVPALHGLYSVFITP